ncbi:hypothetical protein [Bradyrhizobium cenepequi]
MIFIGILASIAAIGVLCWLLFTLAVFALPAFAGVTAGVWAYQTGAGWIGGFVIGLVAAALTFGIGQFLLAFVRPLWLRLAIALAFVAPAVFAGYHATHGIVKHTMPSDTWQIVFSVVGAIAVGVTAFVRVTAMAAPEPSGRGVARA